VLQERLLDGRLKLRHLTIVVTIADSGTIISAAKSLHVTQPVVTRALHEVESVLGVDLFERGPRGVTPTLFGESFLTHARAVLAQIREAGNQIELLTRSDIGRVRVGTHLAGSNLLLPRAIAAVKAEHPRLTVVVREATPDLLETGLLNGDLDLVVGRLTARPPAHLRQERLHVEPIRLVARRDHEAHTLRRPALARLARYPWILPVEQTALRTELEHVFLSEGVELPDNRVECTSILTLRQLLVSTDAIAALPAFIAATDDQLEPISTSLTTRRSVGVTRPADRPVNPAAAVLLDRLRSTARELEAEFL
jgi:DNA-binding transcriptional LysR family regulator